MTNPTSRRIANRLRREGVARRAAVADEMKRFNAAIRAGKHAILHTDLGDYRVRYVDADWKYHVGDELFGRSFCGCNDRSWESLMEQVGEPRNSMFAK